MNAPDEPSFRTVASGDVAIHCATAGPPDGPLVVLLHGFPARWSTWRETMRRLASAGRLVVAPDLRGYGESGKPRGSERYAMPRFVDDVEAVITGFGRERAFVAGHDMGGGIAWCTAMFRPERVIRIATLNSVHPVGLERAMRRWAQLSKSWYVFFFQLPWLPEWFLSRRDFAFVRRSLEADGLARDAVLDLIEGVKAPGALHAALAAYRQGFRDGLARRLVPRKVDLPALSIWGDREKHLVPELAAPPADWVANVRVEHVPDAAHWVQHDAPARVSELLLDHFVT